MYIDDRPASNGYIYATGRPIHFLFHFTIYTFYAVVPSVA